MSVGLPWPPTHCDDNVRCDVETESVCHWTPMLPSLQHLITLSSLQYLPRRWCCWWSGRRVWWGTWDRTARTWRSSSVWWKPCRTAGRNSRTWACLSPHRPPPPPPSLAYVRREDAGATLRFHAPLLYLHDVISSTVFIAFYESTVWNSRNLLCATVCYCHWTRSDGDSRFIFHTLMNTRRRCGVSASLARYTCHDLLTYLFIHH